MIDVKELRIGNWIRNVEGDREEVVNLDFFRWLSVEEYDLEYYEPIQLTEEWLLKFGLKYHDGWDDMKFHFREEDAHNDKRFELLETNQGYETPSGQICKYVHQLQNCFYFHNLTGTELELKQ